MIYSIQCIGDIGPALVSTMVACSAPSPATRSNATHAQTDGTVVCDEGHDSSRELRRIGNRTTDSTSDAQHEAHGHRHRGARARRRRRRGGATARAYRRARSHGEGGADRGIDRRGGSHAARGGDARSAGFARYTPTAPRRAPNSTPRRLACCAPMPAVARRQRRGSRAERARLVRGRARAVRVESITKRFVDPGAFAAPGSPLLSMQDGRRLRITANATPGRRARPSARPAHRGNDRGNSGERDHRRRRSARRETSTRSTRSSTNAANGALPGSTATLVASARRRARARRSASALIRQGDLTGVTLRTAQGDETRWIRLGAHDGRHGRGDGGAAGRRSSRRSRRRGARDRRGELTMGIAGRVAQAFLRSKLTPLVTLASLAVGFSASLATPREEEPQISVPMIDVVAALAGRVATRGRESARAADRAAHARDPGRRPRLQHVRRRIRDGDRSLQGRRRSGAERDEGAGEARRRDGPAPAGALPPLVKPHSIDDVPVLALTLHRAAYDANMLRQIAVHLEDEIRTVPDVAETFVVGGAAEAVSRHARRRAPRGERRHAGRGGDRR